MSPDLFWRMEPDVEMNVLDDVEWKGALALYNAFDLNAGVRDIAAADATRGATSEWV